MVSPKGASAALLFLALAACGEPSAPGSDARESDERRALLEQHSKLSYALALSRLWNEGEEVVGGPLAPLASELPNPPFGVVASPADNVVGRSIADTLSTELLREAIADLERKLEAAKAAGR